jgi:hypothetical protein
LSETANAGNHFPLTTDVSKALRDVRDEVPPVITSSTDPPPPTPLLKDWLMFFAMFMVMVTE